MSLQVGVFECALVAGLFCIFLCFGGRVGFALLSSSRIIDLTVNVVRQEQLNELSAIASLRTLRVRCCGAPPEQVDPSLLTDENKITSASKPEQLQLGCLAALSNLRRLHLELPATSSLGAFSLLQLPVKVVAA